MYGETVIDGGDAIGYVGSRTDEAARVSKAAPDAAEIAARRKHAAKRLNEHVKLFAAYVNAMAIAVAGAATIVPLVNNPNATLGQSHLSWFMASLGLHCISHAVIRLLRREE
ncbi:hypothetical protein mvi_12060 [Methylobacterium indicum]|uniref:Uncharacterized protein n=1 Tax=Methylobacterium indicum TaxID=1775910 RepID=A0A8H9C5M7_9HYPH|nr:hypothetical protein mvi_12060 [Methylobacterium indicum]